jgi:hypothetical protein
VPNWKPPPPLSLPPPPEVALLLLLRLWRRLWLRLLLLLLRLQLWLLPKAALLRVVDIEGVSWRSRKGGAAATRLMPRRDEQVRRQRASRASQK